MRSGQLNTQFSCPTGGFSLTPTIQTCQSDLVQNGSEAEASIPIMTLKPGSDNALPSPNGVIASNLLLLSSYLEDSSYKILAKRTIDAFAIEIIQHPFLYVSMLSAIVLEAVGIKSIVAIGDVDVHRLAGFGRTIVRLQHGLDHGWLMKRNQLLKSLKYSNGEKPRVMICEAGSCRELKDGELDLREELP